jgi:hypothetical protein
MSIHQPVTVCRVVTQGSPFDNYLGINHALSTFCALLIRSVNSLRGFLGFRSLALRAAIINF